VPALLTSGQLNRATLARQMLLARTSMTAVEATQHLVGLQAQLPRPPFIGLWSRVHGVQRQEVVQGLLDKQLVRGTSLRGTLHMMTAADYARFRAPLQAALDAGVAMLGPRTEGADRSRLLDMGRAFFREPHTFEAFRVHVAAAFPAADVRALAHTVRMQVPLLQVPTPTAWGFPASADFITAEAWIGPVGENESATREDLVLRYLAAYGPATIADAQAWSGVGGLKPVFEGLRSRLIAFRGERGGGLFDLPEAPRPPADVPAPVRLLPEWDNAIVSRADGRLLPAQHRSSVFRPGLRVLPTVLVDGSVAGTWKMERRGALTSVTMSLFGTQPASVRREIETEADALLRFAEPDSPSTRVLLE
jgi:hypothetical protein